MNIWYYLNKNLLIVCCSTLIIISFKLNSYSKSNWKQICSILVVSPLFQIIFDFLTFYTVK